MIDCTKCIHYSVCKFEPIQYRCEEFCNYYMSAQLAPKQRNASQETKEYAEGYAAGFKQAAPPKAHWRSYGDNCYCCSNCGWLKNHNKMPFCENCGADMLYKEGEIL